MRRRIAIYFSWNRATEEAARLGVLENRFPALSTARTNMDGPRRAHPPPPLRGGRGAPG
jgi:hypothetical protein